jgi:autotransporter-associated beta strand protein
MTEWESHMTKRTWGPGFANSFDHFVWGNTNSSFNVAGVWTNAQTGEPAQLRRSDGYPNLILEFRTKDTSHYGAFNPMTRDTSQPMMVNEIRLTGNFTSPIPFAGGPSGNPLLFVDNLTGASPKIRLDATSSGTGARFQFQIHTELQLYDNLEVVGNGTQDFIITGALRDFYEPRSITKSGTSILTLKGNNTFGGDLAIYGGQVKLTGATAAINGANAIRIASAGTFSMDSGLVAVDRIEREAGAGLQFTGGELRTSEIVGNLTNQGGNFSPGASPALTTIAGDYTQISGTLTIELGGIIPGQQFDLVDINGVASLGGTLNVRLMPGFVPSAGESFEFLTADAGVIGTFTTRILPATPPSLLWQLQYGPNSVRLLLNEDPGVENPAGDYNGDGVVDTADYVVWRKAFGQLGAVADGNGDGRVDDADYMVWRGNLGRRAQPPASGATAGVPEPSTVMISALLAASICAMRARRRSL